MNLKKLQNILFYFIIFLIPCNLGKHWPQDWSYVHGILVDYLIPTLYLTDILIFILLFLWIYESLSAKCPSTRRCGAGKVQSVKLQFKVQNFKIPNFILTIFLFTVYCLLFTVFSNKVTNKPAAFYKLIKIVEFGLFALWIKQKRLKGPSLQAYKDGPLIKILCLSVIWQSVLAIAQWFKQSFIFGYWFFGEQPYTSATPGIKKISLFGQVKVLPMGTFPHPNVLAGFLVINLIIISLRGLKSLRSLKISALVLGIIALGLTFSYPAWIILVISYWLLVIGKKRGGKLLRILGFLSILGAIGGLQSLKGLKFKSLIEPSSITRRQELISIAFKMWKSSPIFGVGLNNFIPRMEEFGRITANYRFLQPVHNIFLLVLSEMGILGILGVVGGLGIIFKKLWEKRRKKSMTVHYSLFTVILFLGLFDHYWLTIQQGMLVVSIVFGLIL